MAVWLYNVDTGQPEAVEPGEVTERIKSLNYTFPNRHDIPVLDAEGRVNHLGPVEAQKAILDSGYTFPVDSFTYDKSRAYTEGRKEGLAASTGYLAANALTGGLVSALATSPSGAGGGSNLDDPKNLYTKEYLRGIRDENPVLHVAAEIAAAVPKVATGTALASYAASKLPRFIASEGLKRVARDVPADAIIGFGQAIQETALGDPDDLAENLVSNVGGAVLFGGALTGVLHGTSKLVAAARNKVSPKIAANEADVHRAFDAIGLPKGGRKALFNRADELVKVLEDTPHPDGGHIISDKVTQTVRGNAKRVLESAEQ